MPLRGKVPIPEEQRLKVLLYGPPNGGKTTSALQFPYSYIIDTAKETARYTELVIKRKSKVFNCSDFFKIKKEIIALRDEKHPFRTLILDEASTPYQKLQRYWLDRFIAALESKRAKKGNPEENLLEDFGMRYWDKVKRDWKEFIDIIRQLDMNVIFITHEKNKYGTHQNIIGVTPDSEKDDEYVFDFAFRIIKRGDKPTAQTTKQRNLPKDEFPNAINFPPEFEWKYKTILKFYEKEYIERPSKNSQIEDDQKPTLTTPASTLDQADKKNNSFPANLIPNNTPSKNKETVIPPEEYKTEGRKRSKLTPILKQIKKLIVDNNVPIDDFKKFLRETCGWKDAKTFTSLTEKHQNTLVKSWDKVYKKFLDVTKKDTATPPQNQPKDNNQSKLDPTVAINPGGPIRSDQIEAYHKKLNEVGMSLEDFLKGFYIKRLEDLPEEGAANILKNFETITGGFQR